ASVGLNLGLHYLSGAVTFDPAVTSVDGLLASKIVWLDSFLKNVDRTARNTNMLLWRKELWLIDHGAALYFHHSWMDWEAQAQRPFVNIKDHVLLPFADQLDKADEEFNALLNEEIINSIVNRIPDEWLLTDSPFENTDQHKRAYQQFLNERFSHSKLFVKEAQNAREVLV